MNTTSSVNPVPQILEDHPELAQDIGVALNRPDTVVIKSGPCFVLMYPTDDSWHIQYAAGPIKRITRLIYDTVPHMLPFVTFHRNFGTGEPRKYRTDKLYHECLQQNA